MGIDKNRRGYLQERHVRLFLFMLKSPAWLDLSGNAVKLLVHLASWEKGDNNGEIYLSERSAATGIGVSKRTAGKLFDELEEHGFIVPTAKGHFAVKRGPATQWRLTWIAWPAAQKGPTNEWRKWSPVKEKSRVQFLTDTGKEIAPVIPVRRETGVAIAPVSADYPDLEGAKSNPHTIAIGEGAPTVSAGNVLEGDFARGRDRSSPRQGGGVLSSASSDGTPSRPENCRVHNSEFDPPRKGLTCGR